MELPFVEAAPIIQVDFATGPGNVKGVHLPFVCVDRAHVLSGSAALRALWAHELSPKVLEGYDPINLSEETMLRIVARAKMYDDRRMAAAKGEEQAALWMAKENAAVAVFQMDSATLEAARAASRTADVDTIRACLRKSSVSHVLAPQGGSLDRSAEEVARSSEAGAFMRDPREMAQHSHSAGLGQRQGCLMVHRRQSALPSMRMCARGRLVSGRTTSPSLHPRTQTRG